MTRDLIKAREMLFDGGYTCVLSKDDDVRTSVLRGVRPLLDFYESADSFEGYSAADKVVGAGAAYIYVLLGISGLYANIISERAVAVLDRYSISYTADAIVPQIVNRTGDGFCPIETAVTGATSPEDALERISTTLKKLADK